MIDSKLLVSVSNGVGILKINNLAKKNALDNQTIQELVENLNNFEQDDSVKVILLSGNDHVFCAGGDIKAMRQREEMFSGDGIQLQKNYEWGIQEIPRQIERMSTPIIAVVNGGAIGAGVDLACMCDLRVGSDRSFFSETFALFALVPGDGGTFFLPRVVGYPKAMEMFLTGDKYDAKASLDIGLLNYLVPDESLWEMSMSIANKILNNSHQAIRFTKKSLKSSWRHRDLESSLDQLSAFQGLTQFSEDHYHRIKK